MRSEAGSKCSVSCCDPPAAAQDRLLAGELGADAAFDEAEGVHVLQLGLHPELLAADGAQRDVGVAAQRALLHVHVGDAEHAHRGAQQPQPLAGGLGGAQVGLGDDLRERGAAAVEVDDRGIGAVDAPGGADVHELGGVLLEVHAVDAHLPESPAKAERQVVLGDLVALGKVGVEVVLAMEDRPRRELGAEREADHQPEVHGPRVGDWQAAGQAQGRPGRCGCWAARRRRARSRRTSSWPWPAGCGSPGR